MYDKLAEELKSARENKDLSLQQLSAKTKIDKKFLESIEMGDFSFLPELYVKAFIKQYAKSVGLDESKIIKKYVAIKSGKPIEEESPDEDTSETEEKPEAEETKKDEKEKPEKIEKPEGKEKPEKKEPVPEEPETKYYDKKIPKPKTPAYRTYDHIPAPEIDTSNKNKDKRKLYLIGIIAGTAIVIILVFFLFIKDGDKIIVKEKPYEEVLENNKERFEEKPGEEDILPLQSDSLSLTINATDTTWINIFYDNNSEEEFTLFPGSSKIVKAKKVFKMTVGNAGGVDFSLNEKQLQFSGEEGAVQYIQINSDGWQYLSSAPSLNNSPVNNEQ